MTVPQKHPTQRVFIGIQAPQEWHADLFEIQSVLTKATEKIIPVQDIHLTLVPPFTSQELSSLKKKLDETLKSVSAFQIRFLKIAYHPSPKQPRLVWLEFDANQELRLLREKLLSVFGQKAERPFIPHLTLARFKPSDWVKIRSLTFRQPKRRLMKVDSISLFESPKEKGRPYTVLYKVILGSKNNIHSG